MKVLGLLLVGAGIAIFIGLLVTWIKTPELTAMQMFLKYLFYYIIQYIMLIIGRILIAIDD